MNADLTSIGTQELTVAATHLFTGFPLLLLWLAGMALAAARWRRHPRVSLLVILACAVGITTSLASAVLSVLPMVAMRRGASTPQVGLLVGVLGFFLVLCSTAAWGMVLWAAFSGRPDSRTPQTGEASPRTDRL
jgi:hypothetical protein